MPYAGFETSLAGRPVEGVAAEFVQQRRHCDVRIVRQGVTQGERPVRCQLGDDAIGQRRNAVLLFVLNLSLAADRYNGAACRRPQQIGSGEPGRVAITFSIRLLDRGSRPPVSRSRDRPEGGRQSRC